MKKHFSKIISLLILATGVFALTLTVFLFVQMGIFSARKNTNDLLAQIIEKTNKNIELDSIKQNIKLKVSDRETIESVFVSQEGTVDFIQLVESIAKKSDLQVSTKKIEPKESEEFAALNKEIISIVVETRGSWQNTIQYLGLLTNLPYKITITSFGLDFTANEFKNNEEGSHVQTWNANISFDVIKNKE